MKFTSYRLQDVLHHGESLWIELEYLDMDLKKYMDSHPEIVMNPRLIKVNEPTLLSIFHEFMHSKLEDQHNHR